MAGTAVPALQDALTGDVRASGVKKFRSLLLPLAAQGSLSPSLIHTQQHSTLSVVPLLCP